MRALALALGALVLAGCVTPSPEAVIPTLVVTSSAFAADAAIPRVYTCQGANTSPALRIANLTANTTALALILDDPDAPNGGFTHWIFWNLPASQADLPASVDVAGRGGVEGNNGGGSLGYRGPCPPSGTHHYHFRAYGLDRPLSLAKGSTVVELRDAMAGHVVARGELVGTYAKS